MAIINLILNAIEATEPGGRVEVCTRLDSSGDKIEILVSDTGKGIPDEHLGKIFEPFFTTKEFGTGLGMAITHGFVEQHGGSIDLKSKVREGTTFIVTLPLKTKNA